MNSANSIFDADSKQTDFSFTSANYITYPICIVGRIPVSSHSKTTYAKMTLMRHISVVHCVKRSNTCINITTLSTENDRSSTST